MSSHTQREEGDGQPPPPPPPLSPPSLCRHPLPSLRRLSHRCTVIAIAAPPPSLPSLRPIAAPPLLRCHHNRCAATASAVVALPQQAQTFGDSGKSHEEGGVRQRQTSGDSNDERRAMGPGPMI
jgi:hypothetical protein